MTSRETVTISREEYNALVAHNAELTERIAALEADDGSRIPHQVALDIIRGARPLSAFRSYRGLTLRQLAEATGVTASYISEIERGLKPRVGCGAGPPGRRPGYPLGRAGYGLDVVAQEQKSGRMARADSSMLASIVCIAPLCNTSLRLTRRFADCRSATNVETSSWASRDCAAKLT